MKRELINLKKQTANGLSTSRTKATPNSLDRCGQLANKVKSFILILGLLVTTLDNFGQGLKRTDFLQRIHEENYQEILNKDRIAVRFIWTRSFDQLIVIRIENIPRRVRDSSSSDTKVFQKYYVTAKTYLDDLNSYGQEKIGLFDQKVTELNEKEFHEFVRLVDKLKITEKKSVDDLIEDGSIWDFELNINGNYFRLDTNSPDDETKSLGLEMIRLSGLKVKKDKIY